MGPLHAVVRMEKLAPVGNYPNNRMRCLRTGDLSHQQCSGEVCCGSEEKSQRSHGKHCPYALSICTALYKMYMGTLVCTVWKNC